MQFRGTFHYIEVTCLICMKRHSIYYGVLVKQREIFDAKCESCTFCIFAFNGRVHEVYIDAAMQYISAM